MSFLNSPSDLIFLANRVELNGLAHRAWKGIDTWPVIRNTILSTSRTQKIVNSRRSSGELFIEVVVSIAHIIAIVFTSRRSINFIFSDPKYSAKIGDRFLFKDADIIVELDRDKKHDNLVLVQRRNLLRPYKTKSYSLFGLIFLCLLLSRGYFFLNRRLLRSFVSSSLTVGDAVVLGTEVQIDQCAKNLCFVKVLSLFLKTLFVFFNTERNVISCYYSPLGMAVCAASAALGINVVDIQHGVGGENMRAYGRWLNLPERGQNTLPNVFFCWTRFDCNAISKWAKRTTRHRAFVTGNTWLQYLSSLEGAGDSVFLKHVRARSLGKKLILFSASNRVIPEVVAELALRCSGECILMVRMHPSQCNDDDLRSARDGLSNKIDNIIVSSPYDVELFSLLRYVDLHVTESSATIYDAGFLGIHSVILNEEGLDYFSEMIDDGLATFCLDLNQLIAIVETVDRQKGARLANFSNDDVRTLLAEVSK